MLGTLAIASKPHIAFNAVLGQRVFLGFAKAHLFRQTGQASQRALQYVAQLVVWVDEVVAGVDATVVFDRENLSAAF